ncbi:MAG TPA: metal ABC transporter ATP-binding protein [Vicinamibacterales bacterium]|nr:metal ABC transporter ATP-binding protein [Vicinamibacterales bacterium]
MSAATILDVRNLTVRFGETAVLRDLSFSVEAGTSLAIVGPNGAGKTVLFRALIGAIPFSGTIEWAPTAKFGYVPQKLDVERDVPLSGYDFLRARAAIGNMPASGIERALTLVGLSDRTCRQSVGALSGGEFQRLLVAFALIGRPNVLLLDEPTAGVDEAGQERLNDLAQRLQREYGLTVLLISHELSVVFQYATRVLCLGRGEAHIGSPETILTPERLQAVYGTAVAFHVHDH